MWTTTIDEHGRLVISAAKEKISEIARRLADPMSQYNEEYARYWEELNTYWTNYNQGVDGVYPSRPRKPREEPSLSDFEQRYIHEVVRAIRTQLSIPVLFEQEPARVNALTDGAAMLLVDTGCGLEVFGEQLIVRRPSDFFVNPGRFYQINPKYIVRIWFDPNYAIRSWLEVVAKFGKVTFSVV